MMFSFLATFLGGRAIKAVAGGAAMSIVTTIAPAFLDGFSGELSLTAAEIGRIVGQALGAFIIGYLPVYIPRNTPAK